MGGQRFLVPVNAETTVKDLKLFLGEKQRREPRYYRLMLDGQELKVGLIACRVNITYAERDQQRFQNLCHML